MTRTLSILITVVSFFILVGIQYCFEEMQYAKQKVAIAELENRVSQLEMIVPDTTKGLIEGIKAETLAVQIDAVKQQLKATEFNLKSDFGNLLKFGIPATLIAFITFFLSLYKSIYDAAVAKAKEQINKNFRPREVQIKEDSKILVLTKKGVNDKVSQFLRSAGFLGIASRSVDPISGEEAIDDTLEAATYDLLLFNSQPNASFTEQELIKYSSAAPKAMIFSYKGPHLVDPALINTGKTSSANFTAQIYGNLINMLDYKRSLTNHQPQA